MFIDAVRIKALCISQFVLAAMSSGNPFGLSEISHYGSMQRVGGKAGGFINKKFFHPSSLRNQEKLWKAQTEHFRMQRQQEDLEKQRDEERKVETLRKQMYMAGQATTSDVGVATGSRSSDDGRLVANRDQRLAFEEEKRRREKLKSDLQARDLLQRLASEGEEVARIIAEASAESSGQLPDDAKVSATGGGAVGALTGLCEKDTGGGGAGGGRRDAVGGERGEGLDIASERSIVAVSRYQEDVHPNGHTTVWGSWYTREDQRWGFNCCKSQCFFGRSATWSAKARGGAAMCVQRQVPPGRRRTANVGFRQAQSG
eukprot:TRINITY_DN24873_c0_g1_i1.p1 TRINITY_DN24873_c0_g1~~TRINITY_DN24873_c0_g1_i1.p1  ORF type:complete len:315 (-),score=67.70 TRINITY_DN24873_c0_g1_i1:139-1083(-)